MSAYCQFVPVDAAKPWRLQCPICGKLTPHLDLDPDQFNRVCRGRTAESVKAGAGSQLLALTESLRITHPPRCDCKRMARWMDRIGPSQCRQHFNHIVDKVRNNQARWGWAERLTNTVVAAWHAALSGVIQHIDPRDPVPGLVMYAIERAERNEPLFGHLPTAPDSGPCAYFGPAIPGDAIHQCYLLGQCTPLHGRDGVPSCDRCDKRLSIANPLFAQQWVDSLAVRDRHGNRCDGIRNILAGRAVFLAGGGPSANALPLEQLARRGAWTMCINNMAGHASFRPQAMVCTDPPEKFSDSIWRDPQIMKFVPESKLIDPGRGKLRTKQAGELVPLQQHGRALTVADCPNTWGVKRREWIACDDTFFLDDAAPNGQYKRGVDKTGEPRTICTLLFAMRILRFLGASEVFLLGVDFFMDSSKGLHDNYSFGEQRTPDACASNNRQYAIVNDWLCRLQSAKVFARFGISFYNCNPLSGLKAFGHVPFDVAIERVCAGVEPVPALEGWYLKEKKR